MVTETEVALEVEEKEKAAAAEKVSEEKTAAAEKEKEQKAKEKGKDKWWPFTDRDEFFKAKEKEKAKKNVDPQLEATLEGNELLKQLLGTMSEASTKPDTVPKKETPAEDDWVSQLWGDNTSAETETETVPPGEKPLTEAAFQKILPKITDQIRTELQSELQTDAALLEGMRRAEPFLRAVYAGEEQADALADARERIHANAKKMGLAPAQAMMIDPITGPMLMDKMLADKHAEGEADAMTGIIQKLSQGGVDLVAAGLQERNLTPAEQEAEQVLGTLEKKLTDEPEMLRRLNKGITPATNI